VRPDPTVVFRNGIEYFADAVADVVFDQILDEQEGKDDPGHRIKQVQVIEAVKTESIGEKIVRVIQGIFQNHRGKSAANTNQHAEQQHKPA